MYESYNYRNEAHRKVYELRQEIKSIHKDLEEKKLANIPDCNNCGGEGEYFTYLEQEVVTCHWCEGTGKDYLISSNDIRTTR